jgi:hypothetical protein
VVGSIGSVRGIASGGFSIRGFSNI